MPRRDLSASQTRQATAIRRSSRLSKVSSATQKSTVVVEIEGPSAKKRKTSKSESMSLLQSRTSECNENVFSVSGIFAGPSTSSTSALPRTSRASTARERALANKELEVTRKSKLLDEQLLNVSKKEQKALDMIERCEVKTAEATIDLLDEHFKCSLCFEVMAHPYSLHPLKCGHTFDAICILRWFFSKAHEACGGWHEYVPCPICRSQLIVTPERIPRHDITFPFIPNRTVDSAVKDLIGKLEVTASGMKKNSSSSSGRTRSRVKKEDGEVKSAGLEEWRSGGKLKRDWILREKQGKDEMAYLTANWSNLQGDDFILIKARLQV